MENKFQPTIELNGLQNIFRSLRHRNYGLYFSGQGVSLVGTWMQQVAMSWLVYRLTHSALLLGVVSFCNQLPTFLFTSFAGVLVDRWNRHRILMVTQFLSMIQAFAVAVLAYSGHIAVWHLIVLGIFLGLINAMDIPTRQAFLVDLVDKKEDLSNAIALNSALVNGARLLGPSVAGIIIALVGESACFLINGISFFAVLAALLMIKLKPDQKEVSKESMWIVWKEGIRYAFQFAPIGAILGLLSLVSLMGMTYVVLMPIFVTTVFHGGPRTLGFIMAASGVGALVGTFYLAARKSVRGLSQLIPISAGILGLGLIAFSYSTIFWLSFLIMMTMGFGMIVEMASSNTILQTIVEDDKRGRVMSLYAMAFMGMAPLGSLLAGTMAARIGASLTLKVAGLSCLVGAVLFFRELPRIRKLIHPIYVQRGIIPESLGEN